MLFVGEIPNNRIVVYENGEDEDGDDQDNDDDEEDDQDNDDGEEDDQDNDDDDDDDEAQDVNIRCNVIKKRGFRSPFHLIYINEGLTKSFLKNK